MSTTKRNQLTGRTLACRHRLLFDLLESRTALSGTGFDPGFSFSWPGQTETPPTSKPLAVTSTTPHTSSILVNSPTTLMVSFNEALDGFSIGITDFTLVQVNTDGTKTALTPGQMGLLETLDRSNPSGSQIDLSLGRGLSEGHYQLILNASNHLCSTDGSVVSNNGQDLVVTDFTISSPVSANQNSINLGTIGSTLIARPGSFDLTSNQSALNSYVLTLARGHRWSLGLSLTSASNEAQTQTALSLFDANHTLIASDTVGLQNSPQDPYLFAGLDPGIYYVGVSDKSVTNLLLAGSDKAAATYQLQAVANPADQPTLVLGTRLDRADPLSTNPTGLTLQFSGGLQLAGLEMPDSPTLKLVDQSGVTWGVTTAGYNPATGQLQLVFDQAIPIGTYTIELTSPTSLLDLANAAPQGKGLPEGDLATFSVTSAAALPSGDLGPLYPGAQGSTSSTVESLMISPSASRTIKFVVIEAGVYAVEGISPTSGLIYTVTDSTGSIVTNGPGASLTGVSDVALKVGSYALTISNPTGGEVSTIVSVLHKQTVFSELMEGGIAQGAALSLRLVNPQANFGMTDQGSTFSVSATPLAGPGSSSPAAQSPLNNGASSNSSTGPTEGTGALSVAIASPGTASAFGLLFIAGPVGIPSTQSNQISVVGSTGINGAVSLASNSPALSPGLMGVPELNAIRARSDVRRSAEQGSTVPDLIPPFEPTPEISRNSSMESGLLSRGDGSEQADVDSLAGAEWISKFFVRTVSWADGFRNSGPSSTSVNPAEVPPMAHAEPVETVEEPRLQAASFVSPVSIALVLLATAFRYRKYLKFGFGSQPKAARNSGRRRIPHFEKGSQLTSLSRQRMTQRV